MGGMGMPEYLQTYLNNNNRVPVSNWVNQSNYYAGLDAHWITYMDRVTRPAIAYATATVDGVNNSLLSMSTGSAVVNTATKLIKGERPFFTGDDIACEFLSDIWAPMSNFDIMLDRSIHFMLAGGTCPIKLDIDAKGRSMISPFRIDRTYFSTDDAGNITEAFFFISILSSMKSNISAGEIDEQYWLIEHRYYDEQMRPIINYKVHRKSGISNAEVLPSIFLKGISYDRCPKTVRMVLQRMGIYRLNEGIIAPFRDGLGVWLLMHTATNSCIPEVYLGDPLLYGSLDLLWSMDVVFSGSLIDVLNGKGKVLIPKPFLSQIMQRINQANPNNPYTVTTVELNQYEDESFVYLQPSTFDKQKDTPTVVQFDIRSQEFIQMAEWYEKEIAVRSGFAPTSIFPHLKDDAVKTAREVTAEENLTRAKVQSIHRLILPIFNRILREILYQEGISGTASLTLSDYIGNRLQYDENLRKNYEVGLVPFETAVQKVNGLSDTETDEYVQKIRADKQDEIIMPESSFNDRDYYREDTL